MADYEVVVAAGSLRSDVPGALVMPHRWTTEGVTVRADFTGAHLLHLAVAGCVLNDLFREAAARDIGLAGARVTASGDFDPETWSSTGITYSVETEPDLPDLVAAVDVVAEIPRAVRAGTTVTRR